MPVWIAPLFAELRVEVGEVSNARTKCVPHVGVFQKAFTVDNGGFAVT
jgi:hypothetical protein